MNINSIDPKILRRIIQRDMAEGLHDYREDCPDCQIGSKIYSEIIPEMQDFCRNVWYKAEETRNIAYLYDIFIIGFCLGFRYEHELNTKEKQ